MPDAAESLFVTHLEVLDDLSEQTFTVSLQDFVNLLDDRQNPGTHTATVIRLLNVETRDRQPQWVTDDGRRVVRVTAEEYSDIKLSVLRSMVKWLKVVGEDGTGKVM
jgi:hypothetical protein